VKQISRVRLQGNAEHKNRTMQNVRHHPHIVNMIERIDTQNSIYLVLEYCNRGDLGVFLMRERQRVKGPSALKGLPEPHALFFMKQLGMVRCLEILVRDLAVPD
jgi:serine/threonine protein kinase